MTEPETEAGRALLAELSDDFSMDILAIEAEATAAAPAEVAPLIAAVTDDRYWDRLPPSSRSCQPPMT